MRAVEVNSMDPKVSIETKAHTDIIKGNKLEVVKEIVVIEADC